MALYHSAKGSVNYQVVGSPTIVDGVASGFSGNDYLRLNSKFNPQGTWECVVKIRIPEQFYGDHYLIGDIYGAGNPRSFVLGLNKFRDLKFWVSGNGTSWDIADGITASGSLSLGTDYFVRCGFTGSNYFVDYSTDGINYVGRAEIQSDTIASSNLISIGRAYGSNFFWSGSIDLNETYIKVNGQPWFGVCPVEVQKHQFKGPVGYEVVGSPTIVDGVASGFSSSNYLSLPSTLDLSQNWEIETEFTTGNDVSAEQFVFTDTKGIFPIGFGIFTDSKFIIYFLNSEANRVYYKSGTAIENTKYKIKINYSNGSLNLYINDVLKMTRESNYPSSYVNRQIIFGEGRPANKPFNGSIDLNETYIKVNGKLWFYQPAPTKYIVKDGKLVWADPRIYLQSQSSANEVRPYIDTGYVPTVNTTYEWTAQFLINTGFMFGANSGDVIQNRVGHNYASGKDFVWTTIGYQGKVYEVGRTFFSKYTSYTDADGYCYLNGTKVGKMTAVAGETTKHMWLFGSSANDDSETYVTSGASGYSVRIYNFKLYESGLLVRDFVPVPAGLVIGNFTVPSNGMFDIVNQQFYGKVGSSLYDFTIGRDE